MTVSGIGIHTGQPVTVTLTPAAPGSGIAFETPHGRIPAQASAVVETTRCTVLGAGTARLATVEHLLSACAGCGVTDLMVTVDGPELPILDGSALDWTELLPQQPLALRPLSQPVLVTGRHGAFITAYPSDRLRVTVAIHFDHPQVGTQLARFEEGDSYRTAIAAARTFGFIEEVEQLLAAGLARGGSLDNAVVIYPDRCEPPLRWDNELARHKLLDLLGDLYLAGSLPKADIIAVKPSHTLNTQLAAQLAALP